MEKKNKENLFRIIAYLIIGIAVISLLAMTFFPGIFYAVKDSAGNSNNDKCKPATGYTEESWREHMGHHPDIYKECLS